MKKQCSKCKKKLSLRNFYRDTQKSDALSSQCKRCIRKQRIEQYSKNREKCLSYAKVYYKDNKEKIIDKYRSRRVKKVKKIFQLLGDKCSICGFENKIALQIDHINGGGYKHRKVSGGGETYYNDILRNIKKFRLLCANCNFIEGVKNKYRKSIWS